MFDLEQGLKAFEEKDYKTALDILHPLAEEGDPQAELALGRMFERGQGVPQNNSEAFKWVIRASEKQHTEAMLTLAGMYYRGFYVPKDYNRAGDLFIKCAERGQAFAQFMLGKMYENGYGAPINKQTAHMWYNISASNGHEEAVAERDRLTADMTADEISSVQELALDWFFKYPKPKDN